MRSQTFWSATQPQAETKGLTVKEETKRSLAHKCMCYYLYNSTQKSLNTHCMYKVLKQVRKLIYVNVFECLVNWHFGSIYTVRGDQDCSDSK